METVLRAPSFTKRRPAHLSKDYSANRVRLIHGGKEYFDLLKTLIDNATDTIHLQTYIYEDDDTGREIGHCLMRAALRGVKVYLLADAYASQGISQSFIGQLNAAGVNFRFFEPLFRSKSFYFGRRLHHKLVVVDTRHAIVGGINVSNKYNDRDDHPAWLDFALYVEGEVVKELCILANKTWKGFPPVLDGARCETIKPTTGPGYEQRSFVRMRRNDWVKAKNQISASYVNMLNNAKEEVTILSSYFLPGRLIRKSLAQAARRGVRVKVIMAGRSDVMLAKQAERFIYKDLLKNNIEIYEYQKTVLHGKIAVCDDKWLTIGSYNVNNISAYASIELNLEVYDPPFAIEVTETLDNIALHDCIRITPEYINKKNNFLKISMHWTSYQIIRLIFYLCTFYFKQRS